MTLPLRQHREPLDALRAGVLVLLALLPFFIKSGFESHVRERIAGEFQASRPQILANIDSAVRRNDLETLIRINSKYSPCVNDSEFRTAIRDGLANVEAREAEIELALTRHLDLTRHSEESSVRPNLLKPQVANDKTPGVALSILPR